MSYERTPEENEAQSKKMEEWWASLTPEELEVEKLKRSEGMSQAVRMRTLEEQIEIGENLSNSWTEERRSAQAERMRQYNLEHWAKGDHPAMSPEAQESAKTGARDFWADEEKKNNLIQTRSTPKRSLNDLEEYSLTLIEKVAPGRFSFNFGELIVGSKIPDFYEKDGSKKLIEIFGSYWHGSDFEGLSDRELVDYYSKLGYSCLVLWEEEVDCGSALWKLKYFLRPRIIVTIDQKFSDLKYAVECLRWPWSPKEGR